MSLQQMYRTEPDGTRVAIDSEGKSLDERLSEFDKPPTGRVGKLLQHVADVLEGKEHAESFIGKVLERLTRAREDKPSDIRDVIMDDRPRVAEHDGQMNMHGSLAQTESTRPSLGDMIKQRQEEQGKVNPVVAAVNGAASELGVTGNQLLEAVTAANAHVQPGTKSRAMEEVAEALGVSQEALIKAGRDNGFTMENGKIIVEVREPPAQKISEEILKHFERPDWAGNHQAQQDDAPQGARVASAAGKSAGMEGRA